MMKHLCSLVLALGLIVAVAAPARAAEPPVVSGVVETPNAIFFQPVAFPNVVWYFPRTELKLAIVEPVLPGSTYAFWKASLMMKKFGPEDLALLPAAWAGKTIAPYIIRPTTECALAPVPEFRTIVQEVKAKDRNISGGNQLTPVCRFSFRMPRPIPAELQGRIDALLAAKTLITHELRLQMTQAAGSIAWADVHEAVAAILDQPPASVVAPVLTTAEAVAAIEAALASPALSVVNAAMTASERQTFIDAALGQLFRADPLETEDALHFVTVAPLGTVVYHMQLIDRLM